MCIRDRSGTIRLPIAREEGSTIKRIVSPNGVEAITHYQTIRSNNGCSLLRIQLETGRTHQIRVHFSHLGHPLAGDFLYGTQLPELPQGHALHSEQLKLYNPISVSYTHLDVYKRQILETILRVHKKPLITPSKQTVIISARNFSQRIHGNPNLLFWEDGDDQFTK